MVVVVFHWNTKLQSPWLSSGKGATVYLFVSKTEYLRFGLSLILLNIKCWYHSFLAEDTTDGYCKQAYSHFFYWWATCFLHRSLTPVHGYVWECWLWATFTPLSSGLYFFRKVCSSKTLAYLKQNGCCIRNYMLIQCSCFPTYQLQIW